jgi:hypothetical protein
MIDQHDRRTIPELVARYDLEPSLRDVYVEGPSDRALVELAFSALDDGVYARAYEVDTVQVPRALLDARGLTNGSKGRVLALADELSRNCTRNLAASVVCLADIDLDRMLERCRDYSLLVYTNNLSLDSIMATSGFLSKLLKVVLLGFPQTSQKLLEQMVPILNERLLQRVAADVLEINEAAPPIGRLCTYDGTSLRCDMNEFVHRWLAKARATDREADFRATMDRYRSAVEQSPSYYLHVEDFLELLYFCVHKVKPGTLPDYLHFRRFLFGLVDGYVVASLPEIQELAHRLGVPLTPAH